MYNAAKTAKKPLLRQTEHGELNSFTNMVAKIDVDKLKLGGQRFCEGFCWPKSQIFKFSNQRQVISKKKKKGLRRNPKAFSVRNHKFSDQKQVISKKKRSSLKSEGFFWPKSQILTFFPPKNTNFFLPKKYRGGQEKNRGGIAPLTPRWRRAWCP